MHFVLAGGLSPLYVPVRSQIRRRRVAALQVKGYSAPGKLKDLLGGRLSLFEPPSG